MRNFVTVVLFLTVNASSAFAAPILWSDNGHYYEFISQSRTWSSALARAEQLSFDPDGSGGQSPLAGYLVARRLDPDGVHSHRVARFGEE